MHNSIFHCLESVLQTQNLLTDSVHANKGHGIDVNKMESSGSIKQEDEDLDGTGASNCNNASEVFSNVSVHILAFPNLKKK